MKKSIIAPLIALAATLAYVGIVVALSGPLYTETSTPIFSSSSPVALATPGGVYGNWVVHAVGGPLLIWHYTGATPSAVPSNTIQVDSGTYYGASNTASYREVPPSNAQGLAAALPTGSSTVTADMEIW